LNAPDLSIFMSSKVSLILKVSSSSRKRMFYVGTNPERKMLIPSRTVKGMVTTP
jgi:hypothetical protein